jgi:hypothetical protein
MNIHNKETQKYLLPIALAVVGFLLALLAGLIDSIVFSYGFHTYSLGRIFFWLILACVLPVILLVMYQSHAAAKTALPLMVVGAVLLLLQVLGLLYTLFASFGAFSYGFFTWIPGAAVLGNLVNAVRTFFMAFSWDGRFLFYSITNLMMAIVHLLFLLSNLVFLAICSEYQPFSLLNRLRESIYRTFAFPMTDLTDQGGSADAQQPDPAYDTASHTETTANAAEAQQSSCHYDAPPQQPAGNYANQPVRTGIPSLLLESRSIALWLILSFLTCGIGYLIWMYGIMKRLRLLCNDYNAPVGEFLCFMFVPFYSLYWFYTRGGRLATGAASYGVHCSDNGIIYLLLAIFGFSIVNPCLMQNDLNTIAHVLAGNATYTPNTPPAGGYNAPTNGPVGGAPTGSAPVGGSTDPIEQLKQLNDLRRAGAISEEEFQEKKKDLLGRI